MLISNVSHTPMRGQSFLSRHHQLMNLAILLVLLTGSFLLLYPHIAHAAGTVYYIDNASSAACSNSFQGQDPGTPWCDFTPVNTMTLQPGDSVLLKSGDTWNQELAPQGSGTSSSTPITIGCYGATCNSNYPVINPNSSSTDAVYLSNPSYWTLTNLTLTGGYDGIEANFNTLNHQGLTFQNLYIWNVSRMGIDIDGFNGTPHYQVPSGEYIVSNITISNVTTVNGQNGLGFMADSSPWAGQQLYTDPCCNTAQQNILIKNFSATGSSSCAVWLGNLSHLTMMDSDVYGNTGCGTTLYNVQQKDVTFVNGVYDTTGSGSSADNSAFNEDNNLTDVRWRGNYFHDNYGSALEWTETDCFIRCTATTDTNAEISSNAFNSNSTWNNSGFYGDIDTTYAPFATGSVQNNLYYDTPQTYNTFCHSCVYYTQTGNLSVDAAGDLYNAGEQFSNMQGQSQWSYAGDSCGAWANMGTFTDSDNTWSDGCGGSISRFDETPPANGSAVSRTWTVPHAGTVDVRGWVLKNTTGGNGVTATIYSTRCSCTLWSQNIGANDQVGMATNLDTIIVAQGDQIAFEVSNGGSGNNTDDTVSWNPSIGYTAAN